MGKLSGGHTFWNIWEEEPTDITDCECAHVPSMSAIICPVKEADLLLPSSFSDIKQPKHKGFKWNVPIIQLVKEGFKINGSSKY